MSDFQDILDEPDETETTAPTDSGAATPEAAPQEAQAAPTEPEAPAPAAEPEAPITREDGAVWSEKSQRRHKDGKIVAGEPPAKVEQAPASPTPEAVAPSEALAPEAPAPPPAEPFFVRVNGKRIDVPGLESVPPEHRDAVRGLVLDGFNHRQNFGRMQTEWKQKVEQAEAAGTAKSDKYNKASVYLFGLAEQLLAESPEKLDMVRREVALMLREADLSIPKPQAASSAEVDLEPAARATLGGYIDELLEDHADAKLLSEQDRKDLKDACQARLDAYFVEREDGIVMSEVAVEKDVLRELSIHKRAHQARDTAARDAEKAKAAAAFNAAQIPKPAPKPPATSRPQPAVAGAPSGATKKGWDQAFKDVWKDEDDEE